MCGITQLGGFLNILNWFFLIKFILQITQTLALIFSGINAIWFHKPILWLVLHLDFCSPLHQFFTLATILEVGCRAVFRLNLFHMCTGKPSVVHFWHRLRNYKNFWNFVPMVTYTLNHFRLQAFCRTCTRPVFDVWPATVLVLSSVRWFKSEQVKFFTMP